MSLLAALVCAAWYSPATARDANTAVAPREQTAPGYGEREDVRQFAEELTQRHGWRMEDTMNILAKARHQARVTQLIMPPPAGQSKSVFAFYMFLMNKNSATSSRTSIQIFI